MNLAQQVRRAMVVAALLAFVMCARSAVVWADELSCTTTATQVGSASAARKSLIIRNDPAATATVFVGIGVVTASGADKGLPLLAGDSVVFEVLAAGEGATCIVASGTQVIQFEERKQ